jgi:hypothetical protein
VLVGKPVGLVIALLLHLKHPGHFFAFLMEATEPETAFLLILFIL